VFSNTENAEQGVGLGAGLNNNKGNNVKKMGIVGNWTYLIVFKKYPSFGQKKAFKLAKKAGRERHPFQIQKCSHPLQLNGKIKYDIPSI
jgi:hypothetical protein